VTQGGGNRPRTPGWASRSRARLTDLSVAPIGLGYWGAKLLRNLVELEGVIVPAACDVDASVLDSQRRLYRHLSLTEDVDEVLSDEGVDAVVIATPISTHYDLTRQALLAGKHVLVEKPLSRTQSEARELQELAAERDLVLMPGHTFLYSPPVVAVREMLERGELGRVYFGTSSRVNLGIHRRDTSVIRDLAPHDFSILLYWLGKPTFVRAVGRAAVLDDVVDVAFIDVGYSDGCLVHIDLSWLAPTKLRRTVLVGERKMVVYDDTSQEQVRIFDNGVDRIEGHTFGEFQLAYRTGDIITPRLDPAEPLRLELEDFVDAIRSGRPPRSDVELGLDVVEMTEAAEESLAEGGVAVELECGRVHQSLRA
jgi:predicted dehydrogenase